MATIITITYTDGAAVSTRINMRALCMAEEHAIREHWGSMNESPVRLNLYAAYASLRLAGKVDEPFDVWLDRVDAMDVEAGGDANPTASPNGPTSPLGA